MAEPCDCDLSLDPYPREESRSSGFSHYCRVCNTQLNSCRQTKIHCDGKKHQKRLSCYSYYTMHSATEESKAGDEPTIPDATPQTPTASAMPQPLYSIWGVPAVPPILHTGSIYPAHDHLVMGHYIYPVAQSVDPKNRRQLPPVPTARKRHSATPSTTSSTLSTTLNPEAKQFMPKLNLQEELFSCHECGVSVNSRSQLMSHVKGHKHKLNCYKRSYPSKSSKARPPCSTSSSTPPSTGPSECSFKAFASDLRSSLRDEKSNSLLGTPPLLKATLRRHVASSHGNLGDGLLPLPKDLKPIRSLMAPNIGNRRKKVESGLLCSVCNITVNSNAQLNQHLGSPRHQIAITDCLSKVEDVGLKQGMQVNDVPMLTMFLETLQPPTVQKNVPEADR